MLLFNRATQPSRSRSALACRPGVVEMAEGRWKPSHEELLAFFEEHDNIYV